MRHARESRESGCEMTDRVLECGPACSTVVLGDVAGLSDQGTCVVRVGHNIQLHRSYTGHTAFTPGVMLLIHGHTRMTLYHNTSKACW